MKINDKMNPSSKYTPKTPRREKTTLSSNGSRERLKDPVQVYCRLRPLKNDHESTCVKILSPSILVLCTPSESRINRKDLTYEFKHIFTSHANQKEVFDHVAYPLIDDLLNGKNGLLFTYGVTGSGKTYTLTGEQNNPGIMPRSIYTIFNSIEQFQAPKYIIKSDRMNGFEIQSDSDALQDRYTELKAASKTSLKKGSGDSKTTYANDGTKVSGINETNLYAVFVTYVEIYNNIVYDLLDESNGKTMQSKLIREDARKNMYVNNVVEVEVKSAVEAFDLFNAGQRRKRMAHTSLNAESSRSHSIFNIRVVQLEQGQETVPEQNMIKIGQLSLVDLAGSERCSRTQNTGVRLKEASSINNSLMSLRTCMEILRENQLSKGNRLIPYRDSKLTTLFKNYFEGEGRIEMVVCINPSIQDFEENLQVVKFAELTQDVQIARPEVRYTPCRKVGAEKPVPSTPSSTPSVKVRKNPSVILGPKIPTIKLNFEEPERCTNDIALLIKALLARKQKSHGINKEIKNKERHFRKRLIHINQENLLGISNIRSLKAQLKNEVQKSKKLENKIASLETKNYQLGLKYEEQGNVIKSLQNIIDEKDMKINQNVLEREKIKQKQVLQSEKMTQELDAKLRRQREHLQAAMIAKETKLQKVREVLDSKVEVQTVPEMPMEQENFEPEPDYQPQQTPDMQRRNAVYTSARRRRSRSAGEVWLEHNAVKPVPLGTVLQPAIKKRKSITKLSKAADVTNPKQNKYCLIAQEPDIDGEIETKVYKGDIVPTCGGGAQVIFNDVERLRQESPTK